MTTCTLHRLKLLFLFPEIIQIDKKYREECNSRCRAPIRINDSTEGELSLDHRVNDMKITESYSDINSDSESQSTQTTIKTVKKSDPFEDYINSQTQDSSMLAAHEVKSNDGTSTIIASEIDGGTTLRMEHRLLNRRERNHDKSPKNVHANQEVPFEQTSTSYDSYCETMTVIESEINGGETQMNMRNKRTNPKIKGQYIPAGHERDIPQNLKRV